MIRIIIFAILIYIAFVFVYEQGYEAGNTAGIDYRLSTLKIICIDEERKKYNGQEND